MGDTTTDVRLLKVDQVAERLGLGRAKTWALVKDGRLSVVRIDGSTRVRSDVLDDFIDSLRVHP